VRTDERAAIGAVDQAAALQFVQIPSDGLSGDLKLGSELPHADRGRYLQVAEGTFLAFPFRQTLSFLHGRHALCQVRLLGLTVPQEVLDTQRADW
jgi:hypothetical protein